MMMMNGCEKSRNAWLLVCYLAMAFLGRACQNHIRDNYLGT